MGVTLKDVAERAGVSIPTVSLIINGKSMPFKDKTRAAVLEAVEALNYRPDSMARRNATRSDRRDAIGLLLRTESPSRQANAPVYEFICGVNDVLIDENQFLVLVKLRQLGLQSAPDGDLPRVSTPLPAMASAPAPRVITERFVDGLLIETGLPPAMEAFVARYRIPTIWLNTNHHEPVDCVYLDEFHAGRSVTEHLIGLGHRNIAYFTPVTPPGAFAHYSIIERETGYEQAMAAQGLTPCKVYETSAGSPLSDNGLANLLHQDRGADRVTGIVTYSLGQAIKLREEIRELGLRCPQDFSLIAADDLHHFRRTWPDLTGITCNRYQMGAEAAKMMLAKVTDGGQPQPSLVFKGDLIPGTSVAPPPALPAKSAHSRRSPVNVPAK